MSTTGAVNSRLGPRAVTRRAIDRDGIGRTGPREHGVGLESGFGGGNDRGRDAVSRPSPGTPRGGSAVARCIGLGSRVVPSGPRLRRETRSVANDGTVRCRHSHIRSPHRKGTTMLHRPDKRSGTPAATPADTTVRSKCYDIAIHNHFKGYRPHMCGFASVSAQKPGEPPQGYRDGGDRGEAETMRRLRRSGRGAPVEEPLRRPYGRFSSAPDGVLRLSGLR